MTVARKALLSFLLAAILFTVIAASARTGIFKPPLPMSVLIIFFVIMFFIMFSFLTLKKKPSVNVPVLTSTQNDDKNSEEAAGLENISGEAETRGDGSLFWQIFACPQDNPALLAEDGSPVIYEINGIHYINSDMLNNNKNKEGKLDNNFVKLIEAVVGKA